MNYLFIHSLKNIVELRRREVDACGWRKRPGKMCKRCEGWAAFRKRRRAASKRRWPKLEKALLWHSEALQSLGMEQMSLCTRFSKRLNLSHS